MTVRTRTVPKRRSLTRRPLGFWLTKLVQYTVLITFALVCIVPLFWVVSTSLKTTGEIARNPLGLPPSPHWENYRQAWVQGRFGKYLRNSIYVTLPIVLVGLALACVAGYGFARFGFPGSGVIFYTFLLGLMIPFQSIMIPLFYILKDIGFIGTYWAMIVPSIALNLPFGIFFMRAFFLGLPRDLADAALIDGCNEFDVFWRVMLPLAGPGVSSLGVFQFMGAWNSFLLPLIYMQKEELRPLVLGLMFYRTRYTQNYPLIMAGAGIVMVPIIIVYVIFQRKFIQGLTAGALRG